MYMKVSQRNINYIYTEVTPPKDSRKIKLYKINIFIKIVKLNIQPFLKHVHYFAQILYQNYSFF